MSLEAFNLYQQEALRTAPKPEEGKPPNLAMAAMGLAGEAGEAVDLLKKALYHGHTVSQQQLSGELGDVLWYVAVVAAYTGIPLAAVVADNIAKLRARYPEGFDPARSQNRDSAPEAAPAEAPVAAVEAAPAAAEAPAAPSDAPAADVATEVAPAVEAAAPAVAPEASDAPKAE